MTSARTPGGRTPHGRNRAGQGRTGASKGRNGAEGQPGGGRRGRIAQPKGRTGTSTRQVAATPPEPQVPRDVHDPDGVRLQKVLARAGVGSRRACEDLVRDGRVSVDGQVVRELGIRVDPRRAVVRVDGTRVQVDDSLAYVALNKPRGVVSAMSDPQGRPCLSDYVTDRTERLFHVGRLDADTEGLILLTNDGELAHRLAHPSFEVLKTYLAEVPAPIPRDLGRRLAAGVQLEDGPVRVDGFRVVDSRPGRALVEVVLHEGRKHVVRRLLAEVGHPVERLVRTRIGPVRLADLPPGRYRELGRAELGALMAEVGL
ncbi:MAG: rRNA pseudouridine synthase [Actinomycetales bacterium]|nr:rRNA pseudouridine synthase [Actinomycetales bacterium]